MIDDEKPSDGDAPNTELEGSSDVHLIEVGNRKIYLVGTAHVSQRSVDLVREVIDGSLRHVCRANEIDLAIADLE